MPSSFRVLSVFAVLAIWTFGKAIMGRTKVGNGISGDAMRKMLPGLIVAIIYIYWAAKGLGFYTATTIAFFILISLYDPAPHTAVKSWIKRIVFRRLHGGHVRSFELAERPHRERSFSEPQSGLT